MYVTPGNGKEGHLDSFWMYKAKTNIKKWWKSHNVFRYELASVATMVLINSKSEVEKFICSFFESDGTDM